MNNYVTSSTSIVEWTASNITGIEIHPTTGILTNTNGVGEVSVQVSARNTAGWGQSQVFPCEVVAAGGGTDLSRIVGSESHRVIGNTTTPKAKYDLALGAAAYFSDAPSSGWPAGGPQRCYREDLSSGQTNYGWMQESAPVGGGGVPGQSPTVSRWEYGEGKPIKGDEVWIRWRMYYPPGFDWTTSNGNTGIKCMRLGMQKRTAPGWEGAEYINFQQGGHKSEGSGHRTLIIGGEGSGWNWPDNGTSTASYIPCPGGNTILSAQWYMAEAYVCLDTVAQDSGGSARIVVWMDGVFQGEITNRYTLVPAGDADYGMYMARPLWGQNWNGGVPQNQSMYLADVAYAFKTAYRDDTAHMEFDATSGLHKIGMNILPD
jgi:hypothetical protein